MQRLGHLLGDGLRGPPFGRPVLVTEHGRVPRDPLDAPHELGERYGTGGGAGRRVRRARELLAQAAPARAVTSACAPGSGVPRARESARRPTAETAAARRRRRLSCQGGGQTRRQVVMQHAAASDHPTRRGPIAEVGCGHRDGEHEGQQGGRRGRGRRRRYDAGEEHAEADEGHRHDRGDLVRGSHGAEHDEAAPDDEEAEVGGEAGAGRPGEFHQEKEGERSERREQAHLGVGEATRGRWRTPTASRPRLGPSA